MTVACGNAAMRFCSLSWWVVNAGWFIGIKDTFKFNAYTHYTQYLYTGS